MSSYRRASPSAYDGRRARNSGKGLTTTLAVEEKWHGDKLVSRTDNTPPRDPRDSQNSRDRGGSLTGGGRLSALGPAAGSRAAIEYPRTDAAALDRHAQSSRGEYYVTPASSSRAGQPHRHGGSIDDVRRPYDSASSRRHGSLEGARDVPRAERRGYHLSGPPPRRDGRDSREGRDDYISSRDARDARDRDSRDDVRRPRRAGESPVPARERPMSMHESAPGSYAREPRRDRDAGPPVTTRGFDRLDKHGERASPPARHASVVQARDPRTRNPNRDDSDDDDYPVPRRRASSGTYHDQQVATRGFGVRPPGGDSFAIDDEPEAGPARGAKVPPAGSLPGYDRERDRDRPRARDGPGSEPARMPTADLYGGEHSEYADEARLVRRERDRDRPRDYDPPNDKRSRRESDLAAPLAVAGAAGTGALAASSRDRRRDSDEFYAQSPPDKENRLARRPKTDRPERPDLARASSIPGEDDVVVVPSDDYHERLEREMERTEKRAAREARRDSDSGSDPDGYKAPRVEDTPTPLGADGGGALFPVPVVKPVLDHGYVDEPADMDARGRDDRVRTAIVEPPREKSQPRGILRKPTPKFPEFPAEPRVGVAPHKDSPVPHAPQGSTFTRISRTVVNPKALDEAGERFEEEKDFVVVLRVLPKETIDKLIERTREIRDERDRERRHHRKDKDDDKERHHRSDRDRDRERDHKEHKDHKERDRDKGERRRRHRTSGTGDKDDKGDKRGGSGSATDDD